jgi:hypothetical protein
MTAFMLLIAATVPPLATPQGLDARLITGLVLNIDRISEPLIVDGISMTVQRVTGAGATELARRIEANWHRQGSAVKTNQQGAWTVLSRLQGPTSEVLLWRTTAAGPELLLSTLDVRAPIRPMPATGLTLPAGCNWGRSTSGWNGGQSYIQRSARCTQTMHALSLQLRHSLPLQGWTIRLATADSMHVDQAGAEGFISLSVQDEDHATWLSWVRIGSSQ